VINLAHWLYLIVLVFFIAACDSTKLPSTANNPSSQNNFIGDNKPDVSCEDPEILNADIRSDTTLFSACYLITSRIKVSNNARFEIQPNTILLFQSGTGLTIDGGNLIANGTAREPIYFTSDIALPGAWVGIKIKNRNMFPQSLNYVVIEYAGVDGFDNHAASFAVAHQPGQEVFNKGKLTFNNNVIRNSGSKYAFYSDIYSNMETLENNTIYNNTAYPIHITPDDITLISESNRFEYQGFSNDVNKIYINESRLGNLEGIQNQQAQSINWKNLGIPYLIQDGITLSNSHLTIDPGTEIQFASGADLVITANSSIALEGTAEDRILLTGEDKTPGYWGGVLILGSSSFKNKIHYTTIEYGGDLSVQTNNKAGLNILESAKLSLINSSITHSSGFGIFVERDAQITFSNNLITQNLIAGRIYSDIIKYLDVETDFSGNVGDYMEILTNTMSSAETWPGINIPYLFYNNFNITNALTIGAGATLLFAENKRLDVSGETSSLTAIGEPGNPITFSSKSIIDNTNLPQYWRGIYFRNSNGNDLNFFENVIINYSGYTNNGETNLEYGSAAVRITSDPHILRSSRLEIKNINISNLDKNSWGIFVDQRSTLLQRSSAGNSIENGICIQDIDC